MFDILFRNAKVIDGTGNPWFYGDVGVEGGTVAAVLPPGSTARARRVADVDGKALCPGFVDGHSHSELPLLAGEGMDCKIMQGVTTENLGLDGMSLAPIKDGDKADWKKHLSGLAGTLDVPWTWNSFAEYLDCLQAAKPPLNVSSYVGLGTVRLSVMGMADRPAEDHEIRAMRDLVARCMDEGARGISAGLIYPPSRYQSLEETVAVAKAAAAHGGIYDVHMRNEADAIAESVEEVIAISERSGIPAMITHFKIRGKKNWGRSAALIRRIDEARAAGIDVTMAQYPYTAGSTFLHVVIPPWYHSRGVDGLLRALREERGAIKHDLDTRMDWENFSQSVGWEKLFGGQRSQPALRGQEHLADRRRTGTCRPRRRRLRPAGGRAARRGHDLVRARRGGHHRDHAPPGRELHHRRAHERKAPPARLRHLPPHPRPLCA